MVKPPEWTITAEVDGREISWTYNKVRDAGNAWRFMTDTGLTIDTQDEIANATFRRPDGSISSVRRCWPGTYA